MTDVPESPEIFFSTALFGPLLRDEEMARAFAELILKRLHGGAEFAKQQPFSVDDKGTDWLVTGSHQEPGKAPGTGSWFIRVRKSDCRVEKFGHLEPRPLPEEVRAVLRTQSKDFGAA